MNQIAKPVKALSIVFRLLLVARWVIFTAGQIGLGRVFDKLLATRLGTALATLFTGGSHPWSDIAQIYEVFYRFFGMPALQLAILIVVGKLLYDQRYIPMRAWYSIRSTFAEMPRGYRIHRRYVRFVADVFEDSVDITRLRTTDVCGVTLAYDAREDIVTATYDGVRTIVGSEWTRVGDLSFRTVAYDEDRLNRFLAVI